MKTREWRNERGRATRPRICFAVKPGERNVIGKKANEYRWRL